jgi:hypothetical protein
MRAHSSARAAGRCGSHCRAECKVSVRFAGKQPKSRRSAFGQLGTLRLIRSNVRLGSGGIQRGDHDDPRRHDHPPESDDRAAGRRGFPVFLVQLEGWRDANGSFPQPSFRRAVIPLPANFGPLDRFLEFPRNDDELCRISRAELGQQQEHRAVRLLVRAADCADRVLDRPGEREPVSRSRARFREETSCDALENGASERANRGAWRPETVPASAAKCRRARIIHVALRNSRFAETGWWVCKDSNLGPAD